MPGTGGCRAEAAELRASLHSVNSLRKTGFHTIIRDLLIVDDRGFNAIFREADKNWLISSQNAASAVQKAAASHASRCRPLAARSFYNGGSVLTDYRRLFDLTGKTAVV